MVQTSTSAFLDYARTVSGEVDAALDGYLAFGPDCPVQLAAAMRHSLLAPGKRLRPLLVLMATEACGCNRGRAMPAACAVEMVHTYSLIHDDLPAMDDDDVRRGRPSCHAAYGEATAILAGDALLARAFEIMAADIAPPPLAARCCRILARAAGPTALVGGQADDLAAEFAGLGLEQLHSIHRRKTGAMFQASLQLGGAIGGADDGQLDGLDRYAAAVGLAFQIVDDLLDRQGAEAALGKRAGKDSARGKLTFPSLLGLEESRRRAEQLVRDACEALDLFADRAGHLEALAWYVLARTH